MLDSKFRFRMMTMSATIGALTLGTIILPAHPLLTPPVLYEQQQQPDNTAANKQNAPTADQQKESSTDRNMARKIRESITGDKSLSTYGHNVKVIVRNGTVTLKGPVKSETEKQTIESKAADIAGATNVKNELTVKAAG